MSDPKSDFEIFVHDGMEMKQIIDIMCKPNSVDWEDLLDDYNIWKGVGLTTDALSMKQMFEILDAMFCPICLSSTCLFGDSIGCCKCTLWYHDKCVGKIRNDFKCSFCLIEID